MPKRRIHVLHGFYGTEIPYSCTYIRLLCPLSHPSLAERIELSHGTSEAIPDCDLLVVERHTLWPYERQLDGFVRVLSRCRRAGIPVVYELDDNLLDLRRDEPWDSYPGDSLRGVVAFLARQADGMIVSTPFLAERVRQLRGDALVVPNALDERLFGSAPEPLESRSATVTIGYMGTLTHEADLRMVLAPLRALLRRHAGSVRLELVGGAVGRRMASLFEGLPFRMREPGNEDPYPRFVSWMRQHLRWDVAIAPLVDDAFTRGKSDLKYLDYAALGVPGVFSDVGAYRGTVRHRETGLLAANEPGAWAEALEEIVGDGALRARLAAAATAEVHGSRMLRTNATLWRDAIETIVPGFFG
ncbi:MAG: glycosyltransferase [Thermoanaerobaculia bacterium]|nr:glycosyltransferase [Thermoanaerobaculia bacterium]